MNQAKYRLLLARAWHDIAAAQSARLVVEGDQGGWYRALREPRTLSQFAEAAGLDPRAAQLWLTNQISAGYITTNGTQFFLDEEQAAAFTGDDSVPAGFHLAALLTAGVAQTVDAIDRMSAANARNLASRWIPEDLRDGTILDVGCGRGGVARELARQFPNARIHGIDLREEPAADDRVTFERCDAAAATGTYDLALLVDVLHELADPARVLRHLRTHARAIVIVEPLLEDALGARLMSAAAFLYCLPVSGHAGFRDEPALRELVAAAGFPTARRRDDPSHLVLEAR